MLGSATIPHWTHSSVRGSSSATRQRDPAGCPYLQRDRPRRVRVRRAAWSRSAALASPPLSGLTMVSAINSARSGWGASRQEQMRPPVSSEEPSVIGHRSATTRRDLSITCRYVHGGFASFRVRSFRLSSMQNHPAAPCRLGRTELLRLRAYCAMAHGDCAGFARLHPARTPWRTLAHGVLERGRWRSARGRPRRMQRLSGAMRRRWRSDPHPRKYRSCCRTTGSGHTRSGSSASR